MANWTYSTPVDLTNGGSNDLTESIFASSLPTTLTAIQIFLKDWSMSAANYTPYIRLGDAQGIETTGYISNVQQDRGSVNDNLVTSAFSLGRNLQLADSVSHGVVDLMKWNADTNLWFCDSHLIDYSPTTKYYFQQCGTKTLSSTLNQLWIGTYNGTPTFDGGTICCRYR